MTFSSYIKKKQTNRYARGEHVMGKLEAKLMRRLQSETGMSEEEIRSIKKYRKMLSGKQQENIQTYSTHRHMAVSVTPEREMFMREISRYIADTDMQNRLYKRYAGGFVDDKRPKKFCYRQFNKRQLVEKVFAAIDKTDGMFVFNPVFNEIGFMYPTSLTMFSLLFEED